MTKNSKVELRMTFDPLVIDDLGAKLYSTLPPIISELIANGYDACANNVFIELKGKGERKEIVIKDDGYGMSFDEIDDKYLRIGRKKRECDDDEIKCSRLPTGKKGLGKLAFFGIAKCAVIKTIHEAEEVIFEMDWDKIQNTPDGKDYTPEFSRRSTNEKSGTEIILSGIDRKSDFDTEGLKRSISNYFIFDEDFKVYIKDGNARDFEEVDNELRYQQDDRGEDFSWTFPEVVREMGLGKEFPFAESIKGKIILFNLPVKNNLRGVTLFSRRKLVSLPESFPVQGSSHFYQYLTGWLEVDFVDDFVPDVIATNRSSLNWNDESLSELRRFLEKAINHIHGEWKKKKKKNTEDKIKEKFQINTNQWKESNKDNRIISVSIDKFSEILENPEKIEQGELMEVLEIIYNLAPEHADFALWRNLHEKITGNETIEGEFFNKNYLEAAKEAVLVYNEAVQSVSGRSEDGYKLMEIAYGKEGNKLICVTNKSNPNEENIEEGQKYISQGIMLGFKNPAVSHTSRTKAALVKDFSDRNCLDILSTISYLFDRLEKRKKPTK